MLFRQQKEFQEESSALGREGFIGGAASSDAIIRLDDSLENKPEQFQVRGERDWLHNVGEGQEGTKRDATRRVCSFSRSAVKVSNSSSLPNLGFL